LVKKRAEQIETDKTTASFFRLGCAILSLQIPRATQTRTWVTASAVDAANWYSRSLTKEWSDEEFAFDFF
jgi:hypothetical protein